MTTTAPVAGEPTVRRVRRTDLLDIVRIERASFPQPWPWQAFERFLDEPGFLVADTGVAVVGYIVADRVETAGLAIGHVKDFAVRPSHRRRGIGTRLLTQTLRTLNGAGLSRAKLEVRASNRAAIDLYRRHGFETHHVVSSYYDDGEDAVVMVASLDR